MRSPKVASGDLVAALLKINNAIEAIERAEAAVGAGLVD